MGYIGVITLVFQNPSVPKSPKYLVRIGFLDPPKGLLSRCERGSKHWSSQAIWKTRDDSIHLVSNHSNVSNDREGLFCVPEAKALGSSKIKQSIVFGMIHRKDSLLPSGKVWSTWTLWDTRAWFFLARMRSSWDPGTHHWCCQET